MRKMKKMEKNKQYSVTTFLAFVLILSMFAFMAYPSSVQAQTTSTPEEWITKITQTPDGAWRPTSDTTEYPWECSPAGNPERTGYTDSPGPLSDHVLWRADIPIHNWAFGLVANGTVYTLSMDQGALFALDAHTGEKLWQYSLDVTEETPTSYSIFGPWRNDNWIHVVKNHILAGKGDENKTMMIGTRSEDLAWVSPEGRVGAVSPPGTVFEKGYGVFLTFWEERRTICYELRYDEQVSMTKKWESTDISGRLSVHDGILYGAAHRSTWISAVDATTGELIWNFTTPYPELEFYQHGVIADGKAYFPMSYANKIVVLDAKDGTFLWDLSIDGCDYMNYIAAAHGRLYISGGTEQKVYCVSATDGSMIWEFETAGPPEYYYPIIAQDKVYFTSAAQSFEGYPMPGTYSGYVYCVDAMTGDLVWEYLTPQATVNSWIADGNLYTSTPFGHLWCFGSGPTTTDLSVTSSQPTIDDDVTIYGSVTDMSTFSQEHPDLQSPLVAGVPVVLSYVTDGTWTDFATVNTDSAGTFTYTWTPTSEGTYKVAARFEGNDSYHWSSAQEVVQVGPASSSGETDLTPLEDSVSMVEEGISNLTTYILVILALVIIAIVIAVYSLLKSRK